MTKRVRVYFQAIASTSVEIDVPDEVTDSDDIVNLAYEQNPDFPTLCHHCSGGQFGKPELELGDEWVPSENGDGVPIVTFS